MKKLLLIVMGILTCLSIVACNSQESGSTTAVNTTTETVVSTDAATSESLTPKVQKTIAVVLLYGDNQALEPCINAVEKVASEHGDKIVVFDGQGSQSMVAQRVDEAAAMGVDGIVLHNSDDIACQDALRNAHAAGIPVAIIDGRFKGDKDLCISQTAVNNYDAGYQGGMALAEDLNGEGNVIMIEYTANESWAQRSAGFLAGIEGTDIKVIAQEQCLADIEENATLMENLIQRFNGSGTKIDAVWGFAGGNAVGVCSTLKSAGMDDVYVYCIDGSQMELDLIKSGNLRGTSYLNLYSIAYEGALDLYNYFDGVQPESYYKMVPVTWVDSDNIDEYPNENYIPAEAVDE